MASSHSRASARHSEALPDISTSGRELISVIGAESSAWQFPTETNSIAPTNADFIGMRIQGLLPFAVGDRRGNAIAVAKTLVLCIAYRSSRTNELQRLTGWRSKSATIVDSVEELAKIDFAKIVGVLCTSNEGRSLNPGLSERSTSQSDRHSSVWRESFNKIGRAQPAVCDSDLRLRRNCSPAPGAPTRVRQTIEAAVARQKPAKGHCLRHGMYGALNATATNVARGRSPSSSPHGEIGVKFRLRNSPGQ